MKILFDRTIYPLQAVREAISSFSGMADFTVKREKGVWAVSFSLRDLPPRFVEEFKNHVLLLSIERRRG